MGAEFSFRGRIPPSKSLMNRWLCAGDYARGGRVEIHGQSTCDDVVKMKAALDALRAGQLVDCGAAGTVLRFMAFRASRIPGAHVLTGHKRLFERPQSELVAVLAQLGVRAELQEQSLSIESQGWTRPAKAIEVDRSLSSQFASGILLNAWELDFPVEIHGSEKSVSDAYFEMTLDVVRSAGMTVQTSKGSWMIPSQQHVLAKEAYPEPDLSSAFAVAALAAVSGQAVFEDYPVQSIQPDAVFLKILGTMGADIVTGTDIVSVRRLGLKGGEWNLKECPDLFPVLGVLCALAQGPSKLFGAEHLVHKESNRIEHVVRLIRHLGREVRATPDGLEVPAGEVPTTAAPFDFDPVQDHRLVMAAAVARQAGFPVNILEATCVNKSYPEFLQIAGLV